MLIPCIQESLVKLGHLVKLIYFGQPVHLEAEGTGFMASLILKESGTPALHLNESTFRSCCLSCKGWVWRCYCICLTFDFFTKFVSFIFRLFRA